MQCIDKACACHFNPVVMNWFTDDDDESDKKPSPLTAYPKPFTQASVINAFEALLENVSGASAAFKKLRSELGYIAPERKPYMFFWNGNPDALSPWSGLCGILGKYATDNKEVGELFDAVSRRYNERKQQYGKDSGFEKMPVVVLRGGHKTGMSQY